MSPKHFEMHYCLTEKEAKMYKKYLCVISSVVLLALTSVSFGLTTVIADFENGLVIINITKFRLECLLGIG